MLWKKDEETLEEMKERKETLKMLRWMILKEKPARKGLDFIVPQEEVEAARVVRPKSNKKRTMDFILEE